MKKWFIRIIVILILLIVGLLIYIETNKEALVRAAVDEFNNTIDGEVTYGSADISIFRSFPDLKLSLYDVHLHSDKDEKETFLYKSGESSIDLNMMSLFKSKDAIKIKSASISDAIIHLNISRDGTSNYDIMRDSDQDNTGSIDFDIEDFKITNSRLDYSDAAGGYTASLTDIGMSGRLKYVDQFIHIVSQLRGLMHVKYGKILPSYTVDLSTTSSLTLHPEMDTISIRSAEVLLNDLPVDLNGSLVLSEEDVSYQLDFDSPATSIKKLISLLPTFYKNQYKDIVTSGTYLLNGSMAGSSSADYPQYRLHIQAQNGTISYPGLPQQIERLGFDMRLNNQDASVPYTSLAVSDMTFKSGQSYLEGDLQVFPGSSDGHKAQFDITSDIDLGDMKEGLVLSKTTSLEGIIKGAIKGGAVISNDGGATISDQVLAADIMMSNVLYKGPTQSLQLARGEIDGDERRLNFEIDDLNYRDALDAAITGHLDTPLAAVFDTAAVKTGSITIDAGTIDLNVLSSSDTVVAPSEPILFDIPKTDFKVTFEADHIRYSDYDIRAITATGNLSNDNSTIDYTVGDFKGSQLDGNAVLSNLMGYGLNNQILGGNIKVHSDKLDLNEFISTSADTSAATAGAQLIPDNIDLNIDYSSDALKFKNIDINKSLGRVSIRDQKVIFKNDSEIFGGSGTFTGTFDTDRPEGFNIDLNLELKELQFSETASKLELFSKLIPIAKFLKGKYTATLNWKSDLSPLYIPDLNTLSAYGEIETADGAINGLLPIDTFIRKIVQLDDSQELKLSNTKRYFLVEDGKVIVKEVVLQKDDIDITLSGSHSFSQTLDYQVVIDIPKSRLKGDKVISFVQDKFKFSERLRSTADRVKVQVVVYMGGNITKPTFSIQKINLKNGSVVESIEDQVKETVTEARDSIRTAIEDTITATTDKILGKIDSTKDVVVSQIDSIRTEVTKVVDSTIVSLEDIIGDEGSDIVTDGTAILDSIKTGNVDSVLQQIEDLFGKRQGKLDSLKKQVPIGLLKGLGKKGG